jgi:hypothetical protein
MFRVQVLERLEQARFKRQVARTIVVAAVLGLGAAVNAPLIEGWSAAAGQHIGFAFAAAAIVCVVPALLIKSSPANLVSGLGRWLYP